MDDMERVVDKAVGKAGTRLMELEIERNDALYIRLKLAPSLEALFKWASRGERASDVWRDEDGSPALFHAFRNSYGEYENNAPALTAFYSALRHSNKYGANLMDGDRANIALLRSVGTSTDEGVRLKFDGVYSEEALKNLGLALRETVVALYKQFIRKVRVRASLAIEEVY